MWGDWWGGNCFGYRLISETIPFWMILLLKSWTDIISKNKILITSFIVLIIISAYINFLGAQAASCGFDENIGLWQINGTELEECNQNVWISLTIRIPQLITYFKNHL